MTKHSIIYRDGTSQTLRPLTAFDPASAPIDDRTPQDFIRFLQKYGKLLKFIDDTGAHSGNWTGFFGGKNSTAAADVAEEETYARELAAFLENPDTYEGDAQRLAAYARPHLIKALAFLHLQRHADADFRDLTRRHLDFYVRDILRLEKGAERPDKVNVFFEPDTDVDEHMIPAGTLLDAGRDAQGYEVRYATDENLLLTQARLAQVHTLRVERDETDQSIKDMISATVFDAAKEIEFPEHGFRTFGRTEGAVVRNPGMALTSPLLNMAEGVRTIHLTLSCGDSLDRNKLKDIIQVEKKAFEQAIPETDPEDQPFNVTISSNGKWIKPKVTLRYGDSMVDAPVHTFTSAENAVKSKASTGRDVISVSQDHFVFNDLGRIIVMGDGMIYRIKRMNSNRQVEVEEVGELYNYNNQQPKKYEGGAFYKDTLRFTILIPNTEPAITPPGAEDATLVGEAPYPVLKMELNDVSRFYKYFQDIRVINAHMRVDVSGLRNVYVRNDDSLLNPHKPFEPFGFEPTSGSALYIAHPELCGKTLDSLTLNMIWAELPDNFATHYSTYSGTSFSPTISNTSFQGKLSVYNNRTWQNIGTFQNLFTQTVTGSGSSAVTKVDQDRSLRFSQFDIVPYLRDLPLLYVDETDPTFWRRFYKLELGDVAFQHKQYPLVIEKLARDAVGSGSQPALVMPPYTPKLKTLSFDYSVSTTIAMPLALSEAELTGDDRLLRLDFHGETDMRRAYRETEDGIMVPLLPDFEKAAYMYLGIEGFRAPGQLPVLFQMVDGSGDMEKPLPQISWSYLLRDRWAAIPSDGIITDATDNLINPGIIRFNLPEGVRSDNHLMPGGMIWLRAESTADHEAIPDCLAIHTRAVTATYANQGNDPDHLRDPLEPETISEPAVPDKSVSMVHQLYASFDGRREEHHAVFMQRISERLRHKQRAVTAWDYERLVLEHFPEIFKVKCITRSAGNPNTEKPEVTVVVIPDITGRKPFFPLKPSAPRRLLGRVHDFLKQHCSPFVELTVKNPYFQPINYRVAVRFNKGYVPGYYSKKLKEDLTHFLSPWAYGQQETIEFGTSIHTSTVVHFLDSLPYVDYVAQIKLIEQIFLPDGDGTQTALRVNETGVAKVTRPDAILVSGALHFVDIITSDTFDVSKFQGIGYMILEIDNYVADSNS